MFCSLLMIPIIYILLSLASPSIITNNSIINLCNGHTFVFLLKTIASSGSSSICLSYNAFLICFNEIRSSNINEIILRFYRVKI